MVSRIGPDAPLLLQVDHLGPIHDTIKSIVAAAGIEKMKKIRVDHIPELQTVP